ncbi:HIT family protein [Lacticaseibacillus daqingensis]|uniref:HIT family protein n=1 Tax=Lacticaseibacillus daqingensis TaxID=2486014 RepID=UPI000F7A154D|nr:HIT family protein [Lacticaseibacillus daqingensis]
MADNCLICQRIKMIQSGTNPYFVRALSTGYVVIGDGQYFKGYTLFLAKQHVTELHRMAPEVKLQFLKEMSWVSEACALAFNADKMNLELLGNGDAHVHWHLFPRHLDDTPNPGPVWWVAPEVMFADDYDPDAQQLAALRQRLGDALDDVVTKYC